VQCSVSACVSGCISRLARRMGLTPAQRDHFDTTPAAGWIDFQRRCQRRSNSASVCRSKSASLSLSKKGPDIGALLACWFSFFGGGCRGWFGLCPTGPALAFGKTVAVAVHLQDMDVMREAVEQGTGKPFGAEHGCPLIERQIAGDHR